MIFFFWTSLLFYFSSDFSTEFSVFWALNSWIFCVTFRAVSQFLIPVMFRMLWMLVVANKLKHIALHGSHGSQIILWKTSFTQTFFTVPNVVGPILVTLFLSNSWWNISKNKFSSRLLQRRQKGGEKKRLLHRSLQRFLR